MRTEPTTETDSDGRLLPDRYPQGDLFICDVADAVLKDDMASMEHPVFSLSKNPDTHVRRYENGQKWLEVTPSVKGLATIYDKDVLIFCISQLIQKMNSGEPISRRVQLSAHDVLVFTNRKTGGSQYESLGEALERLAGTRLRTNIRTGSEEVREGFGLIDSYKLERTEGTERITGMTITLSEWVFNAIRSNEVLTLHRDYFRLKKPLERRIYEIARKHCGQQEEWQIGTELLKKKCGSRGTDKEFRRMVRELVEGDHLPDYSVVLNEDKVVFRNRKLWQPKPEVRYPLLSPEAYHDAKQVAPTYDVYYLEHEWRDWWVDSGMPELHSPGKAFVQFCRKRYQRQPNP